MWKYNLGQTSANSGLWVKSDSLPVFITKLLLEHSDTHVFLYHLRQLAQANGRVDWL